VIKAKSLLFGALGLSLLLADSCSMMKPPEMEEYDVEELSRRKAQEERVQKLYTNEQVVQTIQDVLTSPQFRFKVKRSDVAKAEVETDWREEESFEESGTAVQGSEGKYRSYVIVSYDFKKNRINIRRRVQYLDISLNEWREINPRRYHRDEDMMLSKSIMDTLEARYGAEKKEGQE